MTDVPPTVPVSFLELLIVGIIETVVNDHTTRELYAWNPVGDYHDADDVAWTFHIDAVPGRDRSITITDYMVTDDATMPDSVVGVQFRLQAADRRAIRRVEADLHDLFHGRWGGNLGAVTLESARRTSGTGIGQDRNGRQGRTENYYFTVHRPSVQRL